jgi:hypothetical protein
MDPQLIKLFEEVHDLELRLMRESSTFRTAQETAEAQLATPELRKQYRDWAMEWIYEKYGLNRPPPSPPAPVEYKNMIMDTDFSNIDQVAV